MRKIILLLIIASWSQSCFFQMAPLDSVRRVEQYEKKLDSLKNKKRVYNIGRKKYQDHISNIQDSLKTQPTKSKKNEISNNIDKLLLELSNEEKKDQENSNYFDFEIVEIDTKKYPDSVSLFVRLTTKSGESITGLGYPYLPRDSIPLYWKFLAENCLTDKVSYNRFNVEEIRFDSSPKTAVNYLLDYSGSMPGIVIERLRSAIKKMIFHTKKGDEIGLALMSTDFEKEIKLTDDLEKAKQIIRMDSVSIEREGTFIKKPFLATIDDLDSSNAEKKIIVMFADGIFDESEVDEVINYAIRKGISIYTVTYLMQMNNPNTLNRMSEETGGKSYFIISEKEIPYVFAEIYLSLNNYYKITYEPADCNGLHNVGVLLDLPELKLPTLITKSDYFIPIFEKPEIEPKIDLDINFASGSADIEENSKEILKEIASKLKAFSEYDIMITGHTDDIGNEVDNQRLSEKRAESVKKFFINEGIPSERIKTEGKGESEHIVSNNSEQNRRINRRTEITLIKN